MAAKKKKGGARLEELRRQKKHRETGGTKGGPKSKVPTLLKRQPTLPSVNPKDYPGYRKGKLKAGLKRVGKAIHKGAFEFGTAAVNPVSTITDPLVGRKSPINAKNLGGRVLGRLGLGALVPDSYKHSGGKPPGGKPPEKPSKAKASKTWRDRMNARRKY
jgi:hypothetical protein